MKKKDAPAFTRIRKQWQINPKTRVHAGKKQYDRAAEKHRMTSDDENPGTP